MSDENRKDDPGTDPETQRRELTERGHATHPANERPRFLNTRRSGEKPRAPKKDQPPERGTPKH